MEFNAADLFERVATHIPEREAVVCGDARVSYGQLEARSNQLARYLMSQGLGRGDHIGIYAYNRIEWVEAMLACYKVRAVPINVNYRYVESELFYLLDNADFKAIFFEPRFSAELLAVRERLPGLLTYIALNDSAGQADPALQAADYETSLAGFGPQGLQMARSGDDHYVIYTGGTTGMPKGVIWRQEDVVMALGGGIDASTQDKYPSPEALADKCAAPDAFTARSLQLAPLMHGAAQWGMLRGFFEGHTIIISHLHHFDAHWVWQTVEREQANLMLITGDAMARPMLDALEQGDFDLSSLFVLVSSAAIFSPALKERYAAALPSVMIMDSVGSSEGGYSGMTVFAAGAHTPDEGGPRMQPGRDTTVLSSDYRDLMGSPGSIGKIARGGNIPLGYYKDEAKTKSTFVRAANGQRYSIPGDMARVNEDGSITLLGRGSNCINTGGEKVYPEEVEAALKSHPQVYDCLVVGTPHERFGACVTAVVQLVQGQDSLPLAELHRACESRIARYKLPRECLFVEQVQRSPSGKPNYQWAQRVALAGRESPPD